MHTKSIGFHRSGRMGIVHLAGAECDTLEYVGCGRAFAEKMIEVSEVNEAGSVNRLLVINHSDSFVFLMDGDVLEGAKQTRTLNTSVYLAPRTKSTIPVSCVEQGRWRYTSPRFSDAKYSPPIGLRASKTRSVSRSLREGSGHASDQMEMWNGVEQLHSRMNVNSPTGSLSDLFTGREKDFDSFVQGFEPHPDANGLAVFVGKRLLCVDLFNRRDVCAEYFPKIVRGAASEVFHLENKAEKPAEAESLFRAVDFLDRIESIESTTHNGVALGRETRFDGKEAIGFSLAYEGRLVHMAALNLAAAEA